MKTFATIAALLLGTTTASAGIFGLPDHQPNGYRDTGCDPAFQRQITNAAGEYLYSNNPTCPAVGGPSDDELAAAAEAAKVKPPVEEDPEDENGGETGDETAEPEGPTKPSKPNKPVAVASK